MRIKTQISLMTSAALIISVVVAVSVAIFRIERKAEEDMNAYRAVEMEKVRTDLKNFVDIVYEIVNANYKNATNPRYLEKFYGTRLKDIIDIAEGVLREKAAAVAAGKMTEEAAKREAAEEIGRARYNRKGYIWINDISEPYPKMVYHPIEPELNGKILDSPEYNRADKDENLFVAIVRVCRARGEGFVAYAWPKPGKTELSPKLSYARLFKPWGWVIGTGVYIDDAMEDAMTMSKAELKQSRYAPDGYFWINDTSLPYPNMIAHPISSELEGRRLDDPSYNRAGKDHSENLFRAIVLTCAQSGEGYVEYAWPKQRKDGTLTEALPKLSYARLFKPWGWIIGTGAYTDPIDREIARERAARAAHVSMMVLRILIVTAVIVVVAIIVCFLFADTVSRPIGALARAAENVDLNNLSGAVIRPGGPKEVRELGECFNAMFEGLRAATAELKRTTSAKEKIESELNVARDIQMSIIPKLFPAFPERPEFDIYATLKTAKAVGGDLYDFFFIDKDHLCVVIGDVSGKGVPASLFMIIAQTAQRAKAVAGQSLGEIVTAINKLLCADNDICMFVTYFIAIFDLSSGRMRYCNAGHNPPYIIRGQSRLEKVEKSHGVPLGIMPNAVYLDDELELKPKDTIAFYTDGVTEAVNPDGAFYSEERLEAALNACKLESPKGITDGLMLNVMEFAGTAEQADDITIMAITYRGRVV